MIRAPSAWISFSSIVIVTNVERGLVAFLKIVDGIMDYDCCAEEVFTGSRGFIPRNPLVYQQTLQDFNSFAKVAGATKLAREALRSLMGPGEVEMAATKKAAAPTPKAKAEVKKATAPAPKAKAKVAPSPEQPKRGRKAAFEPGMKITILAEGNPKRGTAAERFAKYKNGMTVADYLATGGTMADVRWDVKCEFISVK